MRTIGMVVLLCSAVASADSLDRAWPAVPMGHELSMEDQLTRRIDEWGNRHLELRARDQEVVAVRMDVGHQRGHLRLGYGDAHFLSIHLDSDFEFHDGLASVDAHVDLAVRGHAFKLQLPGFDVVPSSMQGDRYVEIRVPFFKKNF